METKKSNLGKAYEAPSLRTVCLQTEDVITASGGINDGPDFGEWDDQNTVVVL